MSTYSRNFLGGLGALAYAIAAADGTVDANETRTFTEEMLEEFEVRIDKAKGARAAASFEMLWNAKKTSDQALEVATEQFKGVRAEFDENAEDILELLEDMAKSDDRFSDYEKEILQKFREQMGV